MNDQELLENASPLSVVSPRRVYVVFSVHEEWYTPFVKWGIKQYQGQPVKYTHCALVIQDCVLSELMWIEIEHGSIPTLAYRSYDEVQYTNNTLIITNDNEVSSLAAIDLTFWLIQTDTDPIRNFVEIGNYCPPITLRSLLSHIAPYWLQQFLPMTWTCSGYTAALIGWVVEDAFWIPPTPDQLWVRTKRLADRS